MASVFDCFVSAVLLDATICVFDNAVPSAKRPNTADVKFQETAVLTSNRSNTVEFQETANPAAAKRPNTVVFQETAVPAAKRQKIADIEFQETDNLDEISPLTARGSVAKPLPKTADQKLEARNKTYKKAADFLLQCRYKKLEDDASEIPLDFKEMEFTGPQSIMLYLKESTRFFNHLSNQSINACINQGFLIEAQYKADKKADKKIKKKDSYLRMANFLNLSGNEEANMRWFQRRQALAKISDILDLTNFSYSCSASDMMQIAPQIFKANKLGYFE
jgi:hypothetical protein